MTDIEDLQRRVDELEHQVFELIKHVHRLEGALSATNEAQLDAAGRERAGANRSKQIMGESNENNVAVPGNHQGQNRTET